VVRHSGVEQRVLLEAGTAGADADRSKRTALAPQIQLLSLQHRPLLIGQYIRWFISTLEHRDDLSYLSVVVLLLRQGQSSQAKTGCNIAKFSQFCCACA